MPQRRISQHKCDIVEVTSTPLDIRAMVGIGGRYALASKRDASGNRREFACRAVSITPYMVTLAAPVGAPPGERVIARFDELGKLHGPIVRKLSRGFAFGIKANDKERARLAERIAWIEKHKNMELRDERRHKRIIPKNPNATLMLSDGTRQDCFVIDMSNSGLAVSADATPAIGSVLAVGKVIGRVVRRFPEGFALQFVQEQDVDTLEQLLTAR